MLTAISPIDGRYETKTQALKPYYSEYGLIKYRVFVEIQYFIALVQLPLPQLTSFDEERIDDLNQIYEQFDEQEAEKVKKIEATTNHDVKAVEYYIKQQLEKLGLSDYEEFIHFGLTSQDINNTATPLLIKEANEAVIFPLLQKVIHSIQTCATRWAGIPMLARTHGQPASPTTLGKEFSVYVERLDKQFEILQSIQLSAKFGGATGGFNAHVVAYPTVDWVAFADQFVENNLELTRSTYTTQIDHYDSFAEVFHAMIRIQTILIDFARDLWTYISMDYFKQKVVAGEVGSSAMPHKVNPIDFENAEGNLGISNAIFDHLAMKLPISRLQRDLTDSTVLRNVGVPFGHTMIACMSLLKGIQKLELNPSQLNQDLENNWAVVAEAIQTILRRDGYPKPYEALKALTRGQSNITKESIQAFINTLDVSDEVKQELRNVSPQTYVGIIQ